MISSEVLRAMPAPWFEWGRFRAASAGEDTWFCLKARRLGFRVELDPQTSMGHLNTCAPSGQTRRSASAAKWTQCTSSISASRHRPMEWIRSGRPRSSRSVKRAPVAIYGFRIVPTNACTVSTSFWRTVLIRPNSWRVSYASVGSSALGSESRRPLRGLCRRSGVARRSSFMLSHIARAVPPLRGGVLRIARSNQGLRRLKAESTRRFSAGVCAIGGR